MPFPLQGPEPSVWAGYAQRLPITVDPRTGQGGWVEGDLASLQPATARGPADPFAGIPTAELPLLEQLRMALGTELINNHPSPLETKPLLGTREQYKATVVVAPPTAIASAASTAGAQALADGYDASSGGTTSVLTPATAAAFVTLFQFTVPSGRAFLIYSVAGETHDYLGMANVIKYQVKVGTTLVVPETQLGLIGAPSNQLVVQELATENQVVYFQARNTDGESGTLVSAYLLGWSFPLRGTGLTWEDLLPGGMGRSGRGDELGGPEPWAAPPERVQLVQLAPGNPRYGGYAAWVDPRNGDAVWAGPGLSDAQPAFAGFRMIWTGRQFVVDQQSGPMPGFDPNTMTIDG